jgi:NAD(P)-dependent dehydrogenase (short-subunit alcohol dehydrogenase family)
VRILPFRDYAIVIVGAPGDVTNRRKMAAVVPAIESEAPIALAHLNAGGHFPDQLDDFGGEGFSRTIALNLQGTANTLTPVFNAMRERRAVRSRSWALLLGTAACRIPEATAEQGGPNLTRRRTEIRRGPLQRHDPDRQYGLRENGAYGQERLSDAFSHGP